MPSLRRYAVPLILAVSGWLVLILTLAGGLQPLRPAAVFAFALVAPGTAAVRLLPLRDFTERAVLAAALALSITSLVAEAVAIAHVLAPGLVLAILAGLCTVAATAELALDRARPAAAAGLARE